MVLGNEFEDLLLQFCINLSHHLSIVAVGEPPHCLSCSALFAVKRAIESARKDGGNFKVFPLGEADRILMSGIDQKSIDSKVCLVILIIENLQFTVFKQ